jgi:hypothetical protein
MSLSWSVLILLALLVCGLYAGIAETVETAEEPVVISVSSGRVEIRARRAPLADVLDAIGASQGFAVHYDGPRPTQLVTVTLFASRMNDALGSLLFRVRAKYALSIDPKTGRVRKLVVVHADAAPPAARPTPEPTPVPGWQPDPVATVDEPPLVDHPSPPDRSP